MSQLSRRSISSGKQYKQAFTIAVVLGIVLNVIDILQTDGRSFTVQTFLLGGGMTLLYLYLGLNDSLIYERLPAASQYNVIQFRVPNIGKRMDTRWDHGLVMDE